MYNEDEYDAYIRDLYKESNTFWWKALLIVLCIAISIYAFTTEDYSGYNAEAAQHMEYIKTHPPKPKPVKKENQQVEQSSIN